MTALSSLAVEPRWVAWRNEPRGPKRKTTKVPYAPNGERAKANDPASWGTRAQAEAKAAEILNGLGGGIGIELGDLGGDTFIIGLDLDTCLHDTAISSWAETIIKTARTYAEISPSGRGIKLFGYAAAEDVRPFLDAIGVDSSAWGCRRGIPGCDASDHGPAIEIYVSHRFFAVTDNPWPGSSSQLAMLDWTMLEELARPIPRGKSSSNAGNGNDGSRSGKAFREGARLKREGKTFEEMSEALRSHADPDIRYWCREKGFAFGMRELHRIWDRAAAAPKSGPYVIDASAPYDTAKLFRDILFCASENPILFHHRNVFYNWNGVAYPVLDDSDLRSRLYAFLDQCVTVDEKGKQHPFKPNKSRVTNIIDGLQAAANLSSSISAPAWLDLAGDLEPADIIVCGNGLLHLPTLDLLPHTPLFFTNNALEFGYEPYAPAPLEWLKFLGELWPDDPQSINTLQEIFGLCLTTDTRHQKAFLVIGPKRSGKGTIARVLIAMVGRCNAVSPTLASLGERFGLQPLINKLLAVISDARLGTKADQHAIAESVLRITGEDDITTDRKNRQAWTGKMRVRFLVISNELPRLADTSGALASRFIILRLVHSFYGREDQTLTDKLLAELPRILNWSIEGPQRLRKRGHFIQPASAAEAVRELEDLSSPVGAFIREKCELGPGCTVEINRLFEAWCDWCKTQGRDHPGTAQSFGRDLRAACPGLETSHLGPRGYRHRFYVGIGLQREG